MYNKSVIKITSIIILFLISVVFLVVISQGFFESRRDVSLSDPDIEEITAFDIPGDQCHFKSCHGFKVYWSKVQSADDKNPIEGYKLKVWEVPDKKIYVFKTVNGTQKLVEELQPATIFDKPPPHIKPKEYIVAADKNMTLVDDVKKYTIYQISVQAFTKTEDGPLSSPTGLRIGGNAKIPKV